MPLLLNTKIIASLKVDDLPASGGTYLITIDQRMFVTKLVPLGSKSFNIIKVALDQGYLAPDEATFWRDALAREDFSPLDATNEDHIAEFCERNMMCFLYTLKPQEAISVVVHKYNNTSEFLDFTGVITSIRSVEVVPTKRK